MSRNYIQRRFLPRRCETVSFTLASAIYAVNFHPTSCSLHSVLRSRFATSSLAKFQAISIAPTTPNTATQPVLPYPALSRSKSDLNLNATEALHSTFKDHIYLELIKSTGLRKEEMLFINDFNVMFLFYFDLKLGLIVTVV